MRLLGCRGGDRGPPPEHGTAVQRTAPGELTSTEMEAIYHKVPTAVGYSGGGYPLVGAQSPPRHSRNRRPSVIQTVSILSSAEAQT